MIDLRPLKENLAKCQTEWRQGLPTEQARQALLAADAELKSAQEKNAAEQVEVDAQYQELAVQSFARYAGLPIGVKQQVAATYDAIVALVQALQPYQAAADENYERAKRLFAIEPFPSEKAVDNARIAGGDVRGRMMFPADALSIYDEVSFALTGLVSGEGRPFIDTRFMTPRVRHVGPTCFDAVEQEQQQNALKARQIGPR